MAISLLGICPKKLKQGLKHISEPMFIVVVSHGSQKMDLIQVSPIDEGINKCGISIQWNVTQP